MLSNLTSFPFSFIKSIYLCPCIISIFFYLCPLTNVSFLRRGIHYDAITVLGISKILSLDGYQLYKDVWDGHSPLATILYSFFLRKTNSLSQFLAVDAVISILSLVVSFFILAKLIPRGKRFISFCITSILFLRLFSSPAVFQYNLHLENMGSLFLSLAILFFIMYNTKKQYFFSFCLLTSGLLSILCKEQYIFPVICLFALLIHKGKWRAFIQIGIFISVCSMLLLVPYIYQFFINWYQAYSPFMYNYVTGNSYEGHLFSIPDFIYKTSKAIYGVNYTWVGKLLLISDFIVVVQAFYILIKSRNENLLYLMMISLSSFFACIIGGRYYGHYFIIFAIPCALTITYVYHLINIYLKMSYILSLIILFTTHGFYAFEIRNGCSFTENDIRRKCEKEMGEYLKFSSNPNILSLAYYTESKESALTYYCLSGNIAFSQYFVDPRYKIQEKYDPWFDKFTKSFQEADYIILEKNLPLLDDNKTISTIYKSISQREIVLENVYFSLYH